MTTLGDALRAAAAGDGAPLQAFGLDDESVHAAVEQFAETGDGRWSARLAASLDDGTDPLAALVDAGAPVPIDDDTPVVAGADPIELANDTSLDEWTRTVAGDVDEPSADDVPAFGDDRPVFGVDDAPDPAPVTVDGPPDDLGAEPVDALWDTGAHDLGALDDHADFTVAEEPDVDHDLDDDDATDFDDDFV